jgi:hypothetical protein
MKLSLKKGSQVQQSFPLQPLTKAKKTYQKLHNINFWELVYFKFLKLTHCIVKLALKFVKYVINYWMLWMEEMFKGSQVE